MKPFSTKLSVLGIVAFLAIHGFLAFHTRHLKQLNSEHLFLSDESIARYKTFQSRFPEKKVLISHVDFRSVISPELFGSFTAEIQKLRHHYQKQYPVVVESEESEAEESLVEVITFFDIYKNGIHFDKLSGQKETFESIQTFLQKHEKNIQFRLMGKEYIAFLLILNENLSTFEINKIIDDLKANPFFQKYSLKVAGLPYVNYLLDHFSEDIQKKVFPTMFILAFLLTFFFTKNILASCIIFIPALSSLFVTLGLIQYFFKYMNMITSIMPLLVFVINLSVGFHLFFAGTEVGTFQAAMREKWKPIFLSVFTTVIGFGSCYLSYIEVIKQFAILSIIALSITTLLSAFWFSLTLKESLIQKMQQNADYSAWKKYVAFSFSPRWILFLCVSSMIGSIFVAPKIERLTNSTEYFPTALKIKEDLERIQSEIIGSPNFEILLFKGNQESFTYDDLKTIQTIEAKILFHFKQEYQLISSNHFVEEANYFYTGKFELPRFAESYHALRAGIKQNMVRIYPTEKVYRISILGNLINSNLYFEQLPIIEKILKEHSYPYEINGLYYNLMLTQDLLITILAWSFLGTFFVITFIALFFFRNVRRVLIFILVNTIPIFMTVVFMYIAGLSINIATVMTFSISLGMIVDSTFHLTYIFEQEVPFDYYYKTTLVPIMISSFLLVICFGIFGIHGFLPIRHFGLTLAFTLFAGAIFDLYVLPTLITGKQNRVPYETTANSSATN